MSAEPRFSRRHWGREAVGLCRWLAGAVSGSHGKLSAHRIILISFAIQFVRHWPDADQWMEGPVYALLIIAFAMPVSDLMALIPAKEALAAVSAFFASVSGKAAGVAKRVAGRSAAADDSGAVRATDG